MLCHDGYLPEHIFVDDALRVCGVTDFADYEGNLPVHDFAVMRMSGGDSASLIDVVLAHPADSRRQVTSLLLMKCKTSQLENDGSGRLWQPPESPPLTTSNRMRQSF